MFNSPALSVFCLFPLTPVFSFWQLPVGKKQTKQEQETSTGKHWEIKATWHYKDAELNSNGSIRRTESWRELKERNQGRKVCRISRVKGGLDADCLSLYLILFPLFCTIHSLHWCWLGLDKIWNWTLGCKGDGNYSNVGFIDFF